MYRRICSSPAESEISDTRILKATYMLFLNRIEHFARDGTCTKAGQLRSGPERAKQLSMSPHRVLGGVHQREGRGYSERAKQ
jgi:hypothetical protein